VAELRRKHSRGRTAAERHRAMARLKDQDYTNDHL